MSQTPEAPPIITQRDDAGIVTLTLNRGSARNVLSRQMLSDFASALDDIAGDAEARVVLLRAQGPGFCAGHDLREIKAHQDDGDGGAAFNAELFASCASVMGQI
ncbi:MAG: enoyl-CoA hydratase, partial [Rhizobiales bacterium]|nr:enoyl-CoA hydratase [Hyphomicrobiales bacterium]